MKGYYPLTRLLLAHWVIPRYMQYIVVTGVERYRLGIPKYWE